MNKALSEPPRDEVEFVTIGNHQYGKKLCEKAVWYHVECGVPLIVITYEWGVFWPHLRLMMKMYHAGNLRAAYTQVEERKRVSEPITLSLAS